MSQRKRTSWGWKTSQPSTPRWLFLHPVRAYAETRAPPQKRSTLASRPPKHRRCTFAGWPSDLRAGPLSRRPEHLIRFADRFRSARTGFDSTPKRPFRGWVPHPTRELPTSCTEPTTAQRRANNPVFTCLCARTRKTHPGCTETHQPFVSGFPRTNHEACDRITEHACQGSKSLLTGRGKPPHKASATSYPQRVDQIEKRLGPSLDPSGRRGTA